MPKVVSIRSTPALVVEKGIVPPPKRTYPYARMDVGDSFLVTGKEVPRARVAAAHYKRLHPKWDYATRKTDEGTRIWRIK